MKQLKVSKVCAGHYEIVSQYGTYDVMRSGSELDGSDWNIYEYQNETDPYCNSTASLNEAKALISYWDELESQNETEIVSN